MLNDRQRRLYELLLLIDRPLKQTEIAEYMQEYRTTNFDYHNTTERLILTNDIRAINNDASIEKIIISTHNGICRADKNKAIRFIQNQYKAIFRKLKRIRFLEKKAKLDNQFKIFTDGNGDYVSAFKGEEYDG